MPSELTGGRTEDHFCAECGRITVHEWRMIPGDESLRQIGEWNLVCLALSREDIAAGR